MHCHSLEVIPPQVGRQSLVCYLAGCTTCRWGWHLGWCSSTSIAPYTPQQLLPGSRRLRHQTDVWSDPNCHQHHTNRTFLKARRKTMLPACARYEYLSRGFWYCQLRQIASHDDHPIGTCRMGPDCRTAVVDPRLRVHGIRNLRVVDASIFPHTTSGHTNFPAIMVMEKLSDMLKEDYCV